MRICAPHATFLSHSVIAFRPYTPYTRSIMTFASFQFPEVSKLVQPSAGLEAGIEALREKIWIALRSPADATPTQRRMSSMDSLVDRLRPVVR